MGGKDTFVVRLMRAAAADRPIGVYGDGLQERDYLYVDDAVAAMLRARARQLRGPLTVGTGVSTSVLDVCRLASDAIGMPIAITHTDPQPGEMRAVRVDIARARALGYEPSVTLEQGLARTWESLQGELDFARFPRAAMSVERDAAGTDNPVDTAARAAFASSYGAPGPRAGVHRDRRVPRGREPRRRPRHAPGRDERTARVGPRRRRRERRRHRRRRARPTVRSSARCP